MLINEKSLSRSGKAFFIYEHTKNK